MATLNTIFQFRRDTLENWEAVKETFIPKAGEPCVTMDGNFKGQVKIGDGVTAWGELKYVGRVSADGTSIDITDDGTITLHGFDTATAGQYPVKGDDGSIVWHTNEESEVAQLVEDVATLQTDVGTLQTDVSDLQTEVAKKADADTVYTKDETDEQINAKIASTYKPGGSLAFADLPEPAESVLGYVYDVTDAFTATDKFVAGEVGKEYPAGTNVAIVAVPPAEEGGETTYAYDALTGFVDLSGYVETTDFTPVKDTVDSMPESIVTGIHETPVVTATTVTLDYSAYVKGEDGKYAESETNGVVEIPAATDTEAGIMTAADKAKLDGMAEGAEVNVLEEVQINGTALTITDKAVNIPIATDTALGVVKGTADTVNMVEVLATGEMELGTLHTSRLVQNEELILNGGIGAAEFTPPAAG